MNRSLFLQNNISQFIIRYNEQGRLIPQTKLKVVSVSAQHALLKHTNKKRSDSGQLVSLQKSHHRSSATHAIHTNTDQRKQERQYSRVPIDYFDQRDGGNPADKVKGRVVYRGYSPKNTYYYFKTIKQVRFNVPGKVERDFRGEDIMFNSKFESGNLNAAVRVGSREYWLYMREDTNTHGLRQWFFFEARSRRAGRFRFRIYRFTKRFSLYKLGMKPFVRTGEGEWHQEGEHVVYEYDPEQKCFYLQFEYTFEEFKQVYFASLPPYTYTMLSEYLQSLAVDERVSVRKIGLSLGGLDLYSVSICSRRMKKQGQSKQEKHELMKQAQRQNYYNSQKEAIVVLARTHPGETVSNWALEAFIARVLQTPTLTENYNFYILPMLNPDGVFLGNHRTGVLGQDLNRNFSGCDLDLFPEIEAVQSFVAGLQKRHKIAFLFDLHGHSAKKNIFAFGQECEIGSSRYLYGRIIPKILANSIQSFRYDHCLFKASKEKANTARIFFSSKYGLNAVTFQQSYGLLENGVIGVANWRNFGSALADSLTVFLGLGRENLQQKMQLYLSDLIGSQKEAIVRRRERKEEHERQRQLQRSRQKQREREKEQVRIKLSPSKTEGCEQSPPKFLTVIARKFHQKSPNKSENIEHQIGSKTSSLSIDQQDEQSQLSSGDEQLQLRGAQLQLLKKEIVRVGVVNREAVRRELYSMAEKKVELEQHYADFTNRLHHKQSTVVQRIFKFKNRQKAKEFEMPPSFSFRDKGSSIELPAIKR